MKLLFRVLFAAALLFTGQSRAEIFMGIEPNFSLLDIQNKYPNATFTREKPSWALPHEALYEMTGVGILGSVMLKFDDMRPDLQRQWANENDPIQKSNLFSMMQMSQEAALHIQWVRYIPGETLKLETLIKKYGKPNKSGVTDETFKPYFEWTDRGVMVLLRPDEKSVQHIDFSFTKQEMEDWLLKSAASMAELMKRKQREREGE